MSKTVKVNAFTSQLSVNTVINDIDNINNIKDVWNWRCEQDKQGFNTKVRILIE